MKVSWIITLLIGLLSLESVASRMAVPTKDFIKNRRMHHSGSVRANVSKYLKKMTPSKRRQIKEKIWKKKQKMKRLRRHPSKRLNKHYAVHENKMEAKTIHKIKKFEHDRDVKRRELKKIEKRKALERKKKAMALRKKKERRNLDELKKRMSAKAKGKSLKHHIYPISKTSRSVSLRNKKHVHKVSRFLKAKGPVVLKEKPPVQKPRDLDDDIKLKDHSSLKVPTKKKIYATKPVLKSNPNAIKIDRKLLEVGEYADMSPQNEYATQQICQMRQKQAISIAREIVTQQSKRLFEKLTNYLLKGKLLVNMTKQKVNKALAGKIKELLKPGHVGFSMDDIEKVEDQMQNPMDDSVEDAEDYVTKQTYDEFKGFDEGMPNDEKIKWNMN